MLYKSWDDILNLSPFIGHFPDGSELASTRTSPFWILLELRMMKVVKTNGTIRCAKLQSPSTNQHPDFTDWMPFLSLNKQHQSTEGKGVVIY